MRKAYWGLIVGYFIVIYQMYVVNLDPIGRIRCLLIINFLSIL